MLNDNKTEIILPEGSSSLEAITRSETDIQVATAKKYPRNIDQFKKEAMALATSDKSIAETCFYKLIRKTNDGGTRTIDGPSTRLAEIVAHTWKNLRYGSRIIDIGEKEITAQGYTWDMEKNCGVTVEVKRSIWGKRGRYSEDMIIVTCNAACALAVRNAIFKVILFAHIKPIFEACKKLAQGNQKTLQERIKEYVLKFNEMGITQEMLLRYLNKKSISDIKIIELEDLIGVYTSIKEGETNLSDFFESQKTDSPKSEHTHSPSEAQKTGGIFPISPEQINAFWTKVRALKVPIANANRIISDMKYKIITDVLKSDFEGLLKKLDEEAPYLSRDG